MIITINQLPDGPYKVIMKEAETRGVRIMSGYDNAPAYAILIAGLCEIVSELKSKTNEPG